MLLPKTTQGLKNMLPKINIHLLLIAIIVISIPITVLISRQKESINRNANASQQESIGNLTNAVLVSSSITKQSSSIDSSIITKAQARKDIMLKLAKDNPSDFLLYALPSNVRDKLSPLVKDYVEKEVELTGKIRLMHADNIDNKTSTEEVQLQTFDKNNKVIKTYVLYASQNLLNITTGAQVNVKAYQLDNQLVLSGNKDAFQVVTKSSQSTIGIQRTLVIMVKFQDDPTEPYPISQINQMFFSGPTSLKDYYIESSFGQTDFTGNVVGYYTLPVSNSTCNQDQIEEEAQKAAIANGIDPLSYTRWVYAGNFPKCGFWGAGTVGGNPSKAWIAFHANLPNVGADHYNKVIKHEVGHNLGLQHAAVLNCADQVFPATGDENTCTYTEYADYTDVMGQGEFAHINGSHKYDLSWLSSSQTLDVNNNGNFTISRLEDNAPGVKVLRIPIPNSDSYYYLSYRQPVGSDSELSRWDDIYTRGVAIHRERNNRDYYTTAKLYSYLLDTSPEDVPFSPWLISALGDGESVTDSINGITIRQISHDTTNVNVEITIDKSVCRRGVPDFSASPVSQGGPAGQSLNYLFTIKNNDTSNCPATSFSLPFDSIDYSSGDPYNGNGWSFANSSANISLLPGQSGTITKTITSTPATSEALYLVNSNLATTEPRHSMRLRYSYIVTGPPLPTPTPSKAPTPTPTKIPTPTPTPSPTPTPQLPKGNHDISSCAVISGWACDGDNYNQAIGVQFYADAPVGSGGTYIGVTTANRARELAVGVNCGGNPNHGFSFTTPQSLKDGRSHSIYAYGVNIGTGTSNPLLTNTPKSLTCAPPPTPTPTKVPTPTPTLPPGTLTLNPTGDTYIDQSTSTINYGSDNKLMVSAVPKMVSYMTFDISKLKGRRITKATLFLNIVEVKGTNFTASFLIKEAPATWNEKTLTYAIRAPLGAMVGYFPKSNPGEINADLSNWLLGISGKDKISFGIESNANTVRIKSREVLSGKPYLVIDYK